jgi:hypothetical protein
VYPILVALGVSKLAHSSVVAVRAEGVACICTHWKTKKQQNLTVIVVIAVAENRGPPSRNRAQQFPLREECPDAAVYNARASPGDIIKWRRGK